MADKFPDPKVGDPVAYYNSHARGLRPSARQTIEHKTATQITVGGQKFKRSNGDRIGSTRYDRTSVTPWDAALDERLAALDVEEANAKQAADLFKRIEGAAWSLRVRKGNDRKWDAANLKRLETLVETFEDGTREVEAAIDA